MIRFRALLAVAVLACGAGRSLGQRIPNFDRAVVLEDKAETSANASLGDLDGDGRLDIVIGDQAGGGASIYFNRGGVRFSDPVPIGEKQGAVYGLALGDVYGDGSPDIVAARSDAPNMLYLNSLVLRGPRRQKHHHS